MGKTGPELMMAMTEQAQKFGAKIEYEAVADLTDLKSKFDAVILTMGASPRLMGVGEDKYWGKGFSTCAVCDAAFYKGKKVYVVGGGDAAIEDASALTKFASEVILIARGTEFRASVAMQKRVTDNPDKIKVMWKTNLKGIRGERVSELVLDVDGKEEVVAADGLFFAIGHEPATKFLAGSGVELDEKGYIKTGMTYPSVRGQLSQGTLWIGNYPTMTSIDGVFAAGDCVDFRYRQAVTAAGMGVAAALDCEKWLESK
jgi:thioredoxin reductase (NADPH)